VNVFVGKFKSSEGSFKADLLLVSPQELLTLLRESECQEAVKGTHGGGGISDDDLKKLLDRSDLIAKWTSRLNGNSSGKCMKFLVYTSDVVLDSSNGLELDSSLYFSGLGLGLSDVLS